MLLAKGAGSAQFPLTVSFLYFFLTHSAVVRFKKVSMGTTLVSCPLYTVSFFASYLPAITFSILSMMAAAMGVLLTLLSSPAQSSTNMQFWTYLSSRKSFSVNWAGMGLPRLRSHTTVSYSQTSPPMLASSSDSPNIFFILTAKDCCSSSIWATSAATASSRLAISCGSLAQLGKKASSCLMGTGWYPFSSEYSPNSTTSWSALRCEETELSKGGSSKSLPIPAGICSPKLSWKRPAAWAQADSQHLRVLSVKISTSLGTNVPLRNCA